jgi:hypothetical protein
MAEAPITLAPTPPSTTALAQLRVTFAFATHTRALQVAMGHINVSFKPKVSASLPSPAAGG